MNALLEMLQQRRRARLRPGEQAAAQAAAEADRPVVGGRSFHQVWLERGQGHLANGAFGAAEFDFTEALRCSAVEPMTAAARGVLYTRRAEARLGSGLPESALADATTACTSRTR